MTRKPPSNTRSHQPPPAPVDRVNGIPDRAARTPLWKYLLLAAILLGWLAFLIYCWVAGGL
ncbi:MAG: hypothetical protein WC869_02550 [Phycisphaerae bacterium]